MKKETIMKQLCWANYDHTQPLDLDALDELTIRELADEQIICRRMGALPGFTNKNYWQITAIGEQLFHYA